MSGTTPKFASRRFIASRRRAASGPPLTIVGLEPVSHYYYSDRLKLQFWDWGQDNLPPLLLVHGGLDHARNWDWVARALRDHFHVYAMDLRGHGNSAWAPGAIYSIAEHLLDITTLIDLLTGKGPIYLIGHSLGGKMALYAAAETNDICGGEENGRGSKAPGVPEFGLGGSGSDPDGSGARPEGAGE